MNPKVLLLVLPALLGVSNLYAGEIVSSYTTVTQLYPMSDGYLFDTEYSNVLSTCEGGKRWSISTTIEDKYFQAQLSSLLAAFMANKEIRIIVNDDQGPSCYPVIDRFQVK